jgi:hypothetical protein
MFSVCISFLLLFSYPLIGLVLWYRRILIIIIIIITIIIYIIIIIIIINLVKNRQETNW